MPVIFPATGSRWGKDMRGLSARAQFTYTGPAPGAGGYATGGEAVTPGSIKLGTIEYCPMELAVNGVNAIIYKYNLTTGKMQAFWQTNVVTSPLIEVTAGTDLSGYSAMMVAEGRG